MTPQEQRAIEIHTARVCLTEAKNRGAGSRMHATLLQWAGNARRRALAICIEPEQSDLFALPPHHRQGSQNG